MTKNETEFNETHGITEEELITLQEEVAIIREREREEATSR